MHEQSTLGQRIQEGRKAAGFSQETLGERLNVSRQAVSKWEADAAIPELENLIAMSRIFGVSIGHLLGVEPDQPEETKTPAQPPEPDGLTERELAAVEAIAEKYAVEAQRCRRPRWSKLQAGITVGLAAVVILAACLLAKRQVDAIHRQLGVMESQVNSMQNVLDQQVGALSAELNNILDESNNILSDSQVIVMSFDPAAQTVTLRVSAAPKEWTNDTTALFTATLSDGRQFAAKGQQQNGCFVAKALVVPMDDNTIHLSVALTNGSGTRTGALEPLYDCHPDYFRLHVDASWSSIILENNNPWSETPACIDFRSLNLEIYTNAPVIQQVLAPTAVELCLYRNQETEPVWFTPVPEAVSGYQENNYVQIDDSESYVHSYTPEPGETVVAALRVTDNMGMTTWTVLNAFQASSAQSITRLHRFDPEVWIPGTPIPFI